MSVRVIDTETVLFRAGCMAPECVCISFAAPGEEPGIVHADDPRALPLVTSWLTGPELLAGHHVAYDFAVLCAQWPELVPRVFRAYDQDRITCTKIRQQLLDIAAGEFRGYLRKFDKAVCEAHEDCDPETCGQATVKKSARWVPYNYDLDAITYRATGRRLDKDTWRLRYGEFLHTPIAEWPEGARTYPLEDARATLDVLLKQEEHVQYIPDQYRQTRAAWALHLTSVWGLRTHGPGVDKLERETVAALAAIEGGLQTAGLVRADGSRNIKAAQAIMVQVCQQLGKPVRLTAPSRKHPNGQVSLDSDACEASEYDLLEDYAELTSLKNVLAKDIPVLRAGTTFPVHTNFGLAASGRSTSCIARGTPVQTPCDRGSFPKGRPIETIREGDYVYSYTQDGQLHLQRVLWSGCTGIKPVVRLCWQGQGRRHEGELLLTEDHRVMLLDGRWKSAGELVRGDRLTALSCRIKQDSYYYLYARDSLDFREHLFAYAKFTGSVREIVHHKDHNTKNNELSNLQDMTQSEHATLHGLEASPETIAKKTAVLLRPETRAKQLASLKRGVEHGKWVHVSKLTLLRWIALTAGKVREMMECTGHDYVFIHSKLEKYGIDLMAVRKRYNLNGDYLSKGFVRRCAALQGNARHLACRVSYYRFCEMVKYWGLSLDNNHIVFSVEPAGLSEVWDLEVENTHTFVAGEVCVHNSKPNVQNPRRLPGIRETFVPRAGKVFAQGDFSGLELHTLAQTCVTLFGQSHLAEVLNAGLDPHTAFAADILGIAYEEAVRRKKAGDETVDNARQTAKVANFGFPGGLGAEKLCLFARKSYGVLLTEERARELKEQWLARWPEMKLFFHRVGELVDEDTGDAVVQQLFSNRWRGGAHYTAACNTYFQGLGADAAKRATYLVSRACYAEPASVLYGSRICNMIHDELILEVDEDLRAHDKAIELGRLMVLGANEFLPDVPARVEPLLARCWSKKSKPVYSNGRLVPWAA